MTHPRIYIACLAAYNSGRLHGTWIDCNLDIEEVEEQINLMLKSSPVRDAEEWAIHATEGFKGLNIEEQADLEELLQWGNIIASHGEAAAKYIQWASENNFEISEDAFTSRYCGYYQNPEKFALESDEIEERYNWSEFKKQFKFWSNTIDWEKVALELELSNEYQYIKAESYGIYVFRF